MKRLLLAPVFLFLLGGCGFNPESPFGRDVVVESSNRDKYIVKNSSIEIKNTFNKYDYLLYNWHYSIKEYSFYYDVRILEKRMEYQQYLKNQNFPERLNITNYDETKAFENKALLEIENSRESLDGNHAILISFPINYKPFYENKEVQYSKEKILKKTDVLCLNPKLKDETSQNWIKYNINRSGFLQGEKVLRTIEWIKEQGWIASNDNFWLDMEILKKEICEKYAKF